jgi:hypothetical protein
MIPTPFSLLKIYDRTRTKVPMSKASNGTNSCGVKTSMEYIFVVNGIVLMTSFWLKLFKVRVIAGMTNLTYIIIFNGVPKVA